MTGHRIGRALALTGAALAAAWALTGSEGSAAWGIRAEELASAKRYTGAIACELAASGWQPRDPGPYVRLGRIYMAQSRLGEAQDVLLRAYALDGRRLETLVALGELGMAQGLPGEAVAWYEAALEIAPDSPELIYAHGEALWQLGELDVAQAALERAVALALGMQKAQLALGALLARQDLASASQHLAVATAGQDSELAAQAQTLLADLQDAAAAGTDGERSGILGLAYTRQRMWMLARDELVAAARAYPQNGEIQAYLGYVEYEVGHVATALDVLRQAAQLEPGNAQAYHFMGMAYRHLGWANEALTALASAHDLDPGNPAIAAEIAQAYADAGAYQEAEAWFERAVELAPDSADYVLLQATFHIGRVYHVQAKGIPAAEKGAAMRPDYAAAYDLLGWGYYLAGDDAGAIGALTQALTLDPYLASANLHLGEVRFAQGEWRQADELFQRVVDVDGTGDLRPRALERLAEMRK